MNMPNHLYVEDITCRTISAEYFDKYGRSFYGPSRSVPFYRGFSLFYRLYLAWSVFTGKMDALEWRTKP